MDSAGSKDRAMDRLSGVGKKFQTIGRADPQSTVRRRIARRKIGRLSACAALEYGNGTTTGE